jgi:hypothetical protein
MFGEQALGRMISKDALTNGVVDLAKSSMRSDTKARHVMDQRSTNEEVGPMDKVCHRLQR